MPGQALCLADHHSKEGQLSKGGYHSKGGYYEKAVHIARKDINTERMIMGIKMDGQTARSFLSVSFYGHMSMHNEKWYNFNRPLSQQVLVIQHTLSGPFCNLCASVVPFKQYGLQKMHNEIIKLKNHHRKYKIITESKKCAILLDIQSSFFQCVKRKMSAGF